LADFTKLKDPFLEKNLICAFNTCQLRGKESAKKLGGQNVEIILEYPFLEEGQVKCSKNYVGNSITCP